MRTLCICLCLSVLVFCFVVVVLRCPVWTFLHHAVDVLHPAVDMVVVRLFVVILCHIACVFLGCLCRWRPLGPGPLSAMWPRAPLGNRSIAGGSIFTSLATHKFFSWIGYSWSIIIDLLTVNKSITIRQHPGLWSSAAGCKLFIKHKVCVFNVYSRGLDGVGLSITRQLSLLLIVLTGLN